MRLLSAEESRQVDRLSQQKFGVPSYQLMSRAGEAVALALTRKWPDAARQPVMVVCGKGNNGGDGMVAARFLANRGANIKVGLLARISDLKGDAARAAADLISASGQIQEISEPAALASFFSEPPALIVDAIFGTGLNAAVEGLPREAIETISRIERPVISVDIASGVNADTAEIMGVAIKAALTVTFGLPKYGHVSYPGADYCGALEVADIGFPKEAIDEVAPQGKWLEHEDVAPLIRPRPLNAHKGMFGHPLIIAGSFGKSGAALLAARAALRMGAGLVTAAIPERIALTVASGQAELMTEPMADADGHFQAPATIRRLETVMVGKSTLVAGPGIGVSEDTKELISFLIERGAHDKRSLVIDADGLNALAELGIEHAQRARGPVVLTPHPGEAARLLKTTTQEINANRIGAARRLSELSRGHVVLKGARTVIASPEHVIYINSTGNPGMGTPGIGDALSGILGAALGQHQAPMDAIALSIFLHGYAADRIARSRGPIGYITGDVIDELPAAIRDLADKR